jgi:hypothetical protein
VSSQRELPETILSFTAILAAEAAAFQGVAHGLNAALLDHSVSLLDAGYDHSVFGWSGEAATFAGVPAALLLSQLRPARRRLFLLLAATLCFLSLDDAVFIHERIGELDTHLGLGDSGGRLVWPVVYLPLLAGTLAMLLAAAREVGGQPSTVLMAGVGLLGAAVVLEVVSYALVRLGYGFRDWPFVIEILVEEGAELAGWILCAGALTAAAVGSVRLEPSVDERRREEGGQVSRREEI